MLRSVFFFYPFLRVSLLTRKIKSDTVTYVYAYVTFTASYPCGSVRIMGRKVKHFSK